MTAKAIFERLVLVPEPCRFAPFVTTPYAHTLPPLTPQLFLDFLVFWFILFPGVALQILCQHDPTSNLAESRHPRGMTVSTAEYRLIYRALLQKRPIILRSLLRKFLHSRDPPDREIQIDRKSLRVVILLLGCDHGNGRETFQK